MSIEERKARLVSLILNTQEDELIEMLEEDVIRYQQHGTKDAADDLSPEELAELKELTGRQDVRAEYLEPRVGDVRHSLADISMAQQLLRYESKVDLREGLQRTIDWWKKSRFSHR